MLRLRIMVKKQGQKSHHGIILHSKSDSTVFFHTSPEESFVWLLGQSLIFLLQVLAILSMGCTSMTSLSLSDNDVLCSCNLLEPVLQSHQRPMSAGVLVERSFKRVMMSIVWAERCFSLVHWHPWGGGFMKMSVADARSVQRWLISMTQRVTLNLALSTSSRASSFF